jgi:hypothetical protein
VIRLKCHNCGGLPETGKKSCRPCLDADSAKKNAHWRSAPDGMCRSCHRQPRASGKQRCDDCCRKKRESDKARGRHPDRHYLDRYGMTRAQIAAMRDAQAGLCAACGHAPKNGRFDIDHDHETGDVRALLCHGCNAALGFMMEDAAAIRALADYAERCLSKGARRAG